MSPRTVLPRLPSALLGRYFVFLGRRPISTANQHFLRRRLRFLRSLTDLLAGRDDTLDALLTRLRTLDVDGFRRHGPALAEALTPWLLLDKPADLVPSDQPPERLWPVERAPRLRVVFGPGIGVGDEILAARIVDALALTARIEGGGEDSGDSADGTLDIVSAYPGLWRALGRPARGYDDGASLVSALSAAEDEALDLLVVIDFETPGLTSALADRRGIERCVEIALGARAVRVVEPETRWLRSFELGDRPSNLYRSVDEIVRWLGLESPPPRRPPPRPSEAARRLFVSPFTSKFETSVRAWSSLLVELARAAGRPLDLAVDPGAGLAARAVARQIARAVDRSTPPDVRCALAAERLDLEAAARAVAAADAVVCIDSYAAHAGPRFGRPTVVVAAPGYERWRHPAGQSFYFSGLDDPQRTARAMAAALGLGTDATDLDALLDAPSSRRVADAVTAVHATVDDLGTLCGAYDDAVQAIHGWQLDAGDHPLDDRTVRGLPPRPPGSSESSGDDADALRRHLLDRLDALADGNLARALLTR
ncbi:MAG: hypothetical protein AAGC60_19485 [Acidobacteriota bacterium]